MLNCVGKFTGSNRFEPELDLNLWSGLVMCWLRLGLKCPALASFRQLGLEEIVSWAKSQKLGLAWPGFGPGQGFWLIYNFAVFDHEIIEKNRFIICPTLIDSFLSAGHPKSFKKHAKLQWTAQMEVLIVISTLMGLVECVLFCYVAAVLDLKFSLCVSMWNFLWRWYKIYLLQQIQVIFLGYKDGA